jgi:hypothetical protein
MGATNLFVGILGIEHNVKEREIGWKKSQPIFVDPYFL